MRARPGYTLERCPGCGHDDQMVHRQKGTVCVQCRHKLTEYERMSKAAAHIKRYRYYGVPSMSHFLPYINHDNDEEGGEVAFESRRVVQGAFLDMLDAITERPDLPRPQSVFVEAILSSDAYNSHREKQRPFTPEQVDAVRKLYAAIQNLSKNAYAEGVHHGRSLLMQLNSGEISIKDFDDSVEQYTRRS